MNQIKLLTWPDYVSPKTLIDFENEYQVRVQLEIVPSAIELMERMRASARSIDVLVPPDYAVRELAGAGRLLGLDHARLPGLRDLEPRFRIGRAHDPASRVSILKDWGTTGFMFRTDSIPQQLRSWADFWAAAAANSGRVTVLDSPGEVIGAALKMRGASYNAAFADQLSVARDDILRLKPHLHSFETNYKPLLASGAAVLALGWNGDAAALIAQGVPVKYVVPAEGSQIWEDDWAIAADTANPEIAHTFLNFVLRPEVAVQEARFTRYATGNLSARILLERNIVDDPSTYPPVAVLEKLEAGVPLPADAQARRAQLWKEVRG